MALEVNFNSYVDVEEAEVYFETRLDVPAWHEADDEDRESALVTATQLIDELAFRGTMTSLSQSLAWPRSNVSYFSRKAGQVVDVPSNVVPEQVKVAVFEQALHLLTNQDLLNANDQTFERIKVGPIEIADNTSNYSRPSLVSPRTRTILRDLLASRDTDRSWWRAN
jgi:hypothetical protein